MTESIVIAIISLIGTALGTYGGIKANQKVTDYKIDELTREVREHNNFAKRMPVVEEKVKVINHRLDDIEKKVG